MLHDQILMHCALDHQHRPLRRTHASVHFRRRRLHDHLPGHGPFEIPPITLTEGPVFEFLTSTGVAISQVTAVVVDRSLGMSTRMVISAVFVTAAFVGTGVAAAAPAAAGGVGDFLSPAFATTCMNHHGAEARGSTTHGTGTGNGNLAGIPLGGPASQCGGADLPLDLNGVVDQANNKMDDLSGQAKEKFGEALDGREAGIL
ncbi:hypothetical protein [Streptomyces sp. NPDC058335]|uniref:hypothetical protein n=1 Tax=Streptomyces sp. NPDC058335 TaxID=3346451 RepID=UPI003646E77F